MNSSFFYSDNYIGTLMKWKKKIFFYDLFFIRNCYFIEMKKENFILWSIFYSELIFYWNSQGEETGIIEPGTIFIFLKFLYYKNEKSMIKKKEEKT
jgi:hypothetical protein